MSHWMVIALVTVAKKGVGAYCVTELFIKCYEEMKRYLWRDNSCPKDSVTYSWVFFLTFMPNIFKSILVKISFE